LLGVFESRRVVSSEPLAAPALQLCLFSGKIAEVLGLRTVLLFSATYKCVIMAMYIFTNK
jgi:hypothetical protein